MRSVIRFLSNSLQWLILIAFVWTLLIFFGWAIWALTTWVLP
jgi:hypothetical protein